MAKSGADIVDSSIDYLSSIYFKHTSDSVLDVCAVVFGTIKKGLDSDGIPPVFTKQCSFS